MIYETWELNQQNLITFVMQNAAGVEVPGLGGGFTLGLSKNGNPVFAPSLGVKGEMANGYYFYIADPSEADTVGTVSIIVNGAGCVQQNLEYVVQQRTVNSIEFTYTLTEDVLPFNPIAGAEVWFTTDIAGNNIVWVGITDAFGVARDLHSQLPRLDPGTYYVWRQQPSYTFVNPDTEVVS